MANTEYNKGQEKNLPELNVLGGCDPGFGALVARSCDSHRNLAFRVLEPKGVGLARTCLARCQNLEDRQSWFSAFL